MTQAVPDLSEGNHECLCAMHTTEFFCFSKRCINYRPRGRPYGSTTIGHVGTDDGSPSSSITTRRHETPPHPKPSNQQKAKIDKEIVDLIGIIPNIVDAANATNIEVLNTLKRAGELFRKKQWADYWMTEDG